MKTFFLLILNLFIILYVNAQTLNNTAILKSDGKLRKSNSVVSDIITIIPKGTEVNVMSSENGYYKISYKEYTGYLNEIFINHKIISNSIYRDESKPKNCEDIKFINGTSVSNFQFFFEGLRYATITNLPKLNGHAPAFTALYRYLESTNLKVQYLHQKQYGFSNICEEVYVQITFDYDLERFKNIKVAFYSPCTEKKWIYESYRTVKHGLYHYPENEIYTNLKKIVPYTNSQYRPTNKIKLPKKLTCWSEFELKENFKTYGVDEIEGIYEMTGANKNEPRYKLALKKIGLNYCLIYLSGATNPENWIEGEIKAKLISTATPLLFKANWLMGNKSENDSFYITFSNGKMDVFDNQTQNLYIKMFPSNSNNIDKNFSIPTSGTGFALSSNGMIVTNKHVVGNSKNIKIRGIKGNFDILYKASIVATDNQNDLAILKINQDINLGSIPYTFKTFGNTVGEDIFILGYPFRATMGDEVKLTNGIISSKTGFQGNISTYQISAPAQPGNSGGPLFDYKGNLVGIVSSKHAKAENASYAIKATYLTNLIDMTDYVINLPTNNILKDKNLSEKVEAIKNFVYIIETY